MNVYDLIPKDKLDIETAEKLKQFSFDVIEPIIPNLMEWIQDMNWPVAKPVSEYLISISENITNEILTILEGNDEMWKYWCIGVFGIYSEKPLHFKIHETIKRICNNPTQPEKDYGVYEQAMRALKN